MTPIKVKVETNMILEQNIDDLIKNLNAFIRKNDLLLYDQDLTQDLTYSMDFKKIMHLF